MGNISTTGIIAQFEILANTEQPKRCRCISTSAVKVPCHGDKKGIIVPGKRHYVVRVKKNGKLLARYCNISCYDEYIAGLRSAGIIPD